MNCSFIDLLGTPFKIHGRSKSGFDCYGLVIEYEKRLGHKMADLDREYRKDYREELDENFYNIVKKNKIVKTDNKDFGNVVMFYNNSGKLCHIGVLLDNDDYLHCDGYGVRVSNLKKETRQWEIYKWQK